MVAFYNHPLFGDAFSEGDSILEATHGKPLLPLPTARPVRHPYHAVSHGLLRSAASLPDRRTGWRLILPLCTQNQCSTICLVSRQSPMCRTLTGARMAQVYYFWNEVGRALLGWPLELASLQALPAAIHRMLHEILAGVDATFDTEDPLPFLGLHFAQLPVQLLRIVGNGKPWKKLDLCSGKVVELGGD